MFDQVEELSNLLSLVNRRWGQVVKHSGATVIMRLNSARHAASTSGSAINCLFTFCLATLQRA
jgi:hypothetical protein